MSKAPALNREEVLCTNCAAIPVEIFAPQPATRAPVLPRSWLTERSSAINYVEAPVMTFDASLTQLLIEGREPRYQHAVGSNALEILKISSDQGCMLCTILYASLTAMRHSTAAASINNPVMPMRLPTESGITLHGFNKNYFIVRDSERWSLVRFGKGDFWNEKGLLLHDKANDAKVFELIQNWISNCSQGHSACTIFRINSNPGYIPARLIKIRQVWDGPAVLRLIERDQIQPSERSHIEYVALSYCWGENQSIIPRTTTANITRRKLSIPLEELTQTIKDAIDIALKLSKAYLWVDSLCIVQDDSSDLEVHCASMSQVYSNAFCTVAATGAADALQGCFIKRNANPQRPCLIEPKNNVTRNYTPSSGGTFAVLPTFREWTESLKGPLLTRGWALQERELSCRVLHFTADCVVWECRETYASEDDPYQEVKNMLQDNGLKFRLLDGTVKDRKDRPNDYKFSKWMDLVEEYSSRMLSFKEDKLKAIAGLAEAIKTVQVDDIYLSGLWKRDILRQLLWYSAPTNQRQTYSPQSWPPAPVSKEIPSWSWAACDIPIVFDRIQHHNIHGSWKSDVINVTPSKVKLSGLAFTITLSEQHFDSSCSYPGSKYYKLTQERIKHKLIQGRIKHPLYVVFDANPECLPDTVLQCLVIHSWDRLSMAEARCDRLPGYFESSSRHSDQLPAQRQHESVSARSMTGLVLLRCSETDNHSSYRRVGKFNGSQDTIKDLKLQQFEII